MESNISKIKKLLPSQVSLISKRYSNRSTRISVQWNPCGHVQTATIGHISNKTSCPICHQIEYKRLQIESLNLRKQAHNIATKFWGKCPISGRTKKLTTHHILPVHSHPDLILDPNNLIQLAPFLHKELHSKYGYDCTSADLFHFITSKLITD